MAIRILLALAVVTIIGAMGWAALRQKERIYQGIPEKEWILSLTNFPTDARIKEWKELGGDAAPILADAMVKGAGWFPKLRHKTWQRLPSLLQRRIKEPENWTTLRHYSTYLSLQLAYAGVDLVPAAKSLARAMTDEDLSARVSAAQCFGVVLPRLGGERVDLLPYLLRATTDTNDTVREQAVQSLGFFTNEVSTVAPVLLRALGNTKFSTSLRAMVALNHLDDKKCVRYGLARELIPYLTNSASELRVLAANKLGLMANLPEVVVPILEGMVSTDTVVAKYTATKALGGYGARAKSAVPVLAHAYRTGEPPIRTAASNALLQIDAASAEKILGEGTR